MTALAWDAVIGGKKYKRPPVPPPVYPGTDQSRVRDIYLQRIIMLLFSASVDVLKDVEGVLMEGCDRI